MREIARAKVRPRVAGGRRRDAADPRGIIYHPPVYRRNSLQMLFNLPDGEPSFLPSSISCAFRCASTFLDCQLPWVASFPPLQSTLPLSRVLSLAPPTALSFRSLAKRSLPVYPAYRSLFPARNAFLRVCFSSEFRLMRSRGKIHLVASKTIATKRASGVAL